jgi:hypothetical protein
VDPLSSTQGNILNGFQYLLMASLFLDYPCESAQDVRNHARNIYCRLTHATFESTVPELIVNQAETKGKKSGSGEFRRFFAGRLIIEK